MNCDIGKTQKGEKDMSGCLIALAMTDSPSFCPFHFPFFCRLIKYVKKSHTFKIFAKQKKKKHFKKMFFSTIVVERKTFSAWSQNKAKVGSKSLI